MRRTVWLVSTFKGLIKCLVPDNTDNWFIKYLFESPESLVVITKNNVQLNQPITSDELREFICRIKTVKSTYLDEIPNEASILVSMNLVSP